MKLIGNDPPSLLTLATPLLVAVYNENLSLNRGMVNTFCENVALCRFLSPLLDILSLFCRFSLLFIVSSHFLQIAYSALLFRRLIVKKRGQATFSVRKKAVSSHGQNIEKVACPLFFLFFFGLLSLPASRYN